MKIYRCDICRKDCDDNVNPLEAGITMVGNPYIHDPDGHGRQYDLCKPCWKAFEMKWKELIGWKSTQDNNNSETETIVESWGAADGSTMATDFWGGAGPDCNLGRG